MGAFIPYPGADPIEAQKAKECLEAIPEDKMRNIIAASIISLLNNERSDSESLYKKLSDLLECYCYKLDSVIPCVSNPGPNLSRNARKIGTLILESLQLYQRGKHCRAYIKFTKIFEVDSTLFDILVTKIEPIANKHFFRVRCGNATTIKSRADIFHVPFEKKKFACQCRYSEHSFPSLYLASSLYTAWRETAKGEFDDVFFSRYEIQNDIKIIDLIFNSNRFLNEKNERKKAAWLLFMPLFIACSMKIPADTPDNKDEYIIPQLLMTYVRKNRNDIVGIQYVSTRWINEAQSSALSERLGACLVFPTRTDNPSGYCCELASMFALTIPRKLPFAEIKALTDSNVGIEELKWTPAIMYENILHKYADFPFGMAEAESRTEDAKSIFEVD